MAKVFYTERDIEDMLKRGERSLVVTDDVVLTDLAYERARRLGVQLVQPTDTPPAAPIRPYINKTASPSANPVMPAPAASAVASGSGRLAAIQARVKAAVRAQLGGAVDEAVLERIIERVAADLGLKD